MQADHSSGSRPGKSRDRLRTSETYIHWDRGLAIVAGMIGIVLFFFLLMIALPIQEGSGREQITGIAEAPAPTTVTSSAPAAAPATAVAPATGPDQPRLPAIARQFPFVRKGPGINWTAVMNLTQGQRVEVVGRSPDRQWFQIVLPTNARERGWVSQEFLAVDGDVNTLPEVRE
ncbi:MAG: SH3 domain-containing protein [Dehalococcoidia bacterium]